MLLCLHSFHMGIPEPWGRGESSPLLAVAWRCLVANWGWEWGLHKGKCLEVSYCPSVGLFLSTLSLFSLLCNRMRKVFFFKSNLCFHANLFSQQHLPFLSYKGLCRVCELARISPAAAYWLQSSDSAQSKGTVYRTWIHPPAFPKPGLEAQALSHGKV